MAVDEKTLKALESARRYLDVSISALNKDEKSFENELWHVAAELEYALFLFSLMFEDECDKSGWKLNPEIRKTEAYETLTSAKALIKESKKALINGEVLEAYKWAYMARQHVFKVQQDISRKKREKSKNK